jgi:hypothetical protein
MSDGTLSVRRRQSKASEATTTDPSFSVSALRSGTFESFLGTSLPATGQGLVRAKVKSEPLGDADEFRVESARKKRLKEYDRLLKGFKYSAALDSVLRKVSMIKHFSGRLRFLTNEITASSANNNIFFDTGTHPPRWSSECAGRP